MKWLALGFFFHVSNDENNINVRNKKMRTENS